ARTPPGLPPPPASGRPTPPRAGSAGAPPAAMPGPSCRASRPRRRPRPARERGRTPEARYAVSDQRSRHTTLDRVRGFQGPSREEVGEPLVGKEEDAAEALAGLVRVAEGPPGEALRVDGDAREPRPLGDQGLGLPEGCVEAPPDRGLVGPPQLPLGERGEDRLEERSIAALGGPLPVNTGHRLLSGR